MSIVLSGAVFFILPIWALLAETAANVLGDLIITGTGGGLVAVIIVCLVRVRSKRPMVKGDAIRIVCWTIIGYAYGAGADGHFRMVFPQYAGWVATLQGMAFILALLTILFSLLIYPPAPVRRAGHCPQCGYSLRKLTTARCPECGSPLRADIACDEEHVARGPGAQDTTE